jgi:hypothetical protein
VPCTSSNSSPVAAQVTTPAAVDGQTTPTPAATVYVQTEKTVTGSTTFQNLLDWSVSQAIIEKIIGVKMPAAVTVIKNYATGKGLEFFALKTPLQAEVNKLKP